MAWDSPLAKAHYAKLVSIAAPAICATHLATPSCQGLAGIAKAFSNFSLDNTE
jgi:hypothetical protein